VAATDYNNKIIEIAPINANTTFENAYGPIGMKSLSECMELSTAHARKQFDRLRQQAS